MTATSAPLRLGVLGLGSVFSGPYSNLIQQLTYEGKVQLRAIYDVEPTKTAAVAAKHPGVLTPADPHALIHHDEVDVVLVLTSMNEHGPLATTARAAGKHVLVEKPMATSIPEADELLAVNAQHPGLLVCAPHVVLSPTFRKLHDAVHAGEIGRLVLARARYGWAGPWWGDWFYQAGGGALFDLGVYNLTTLCGLFGPVRRVAAMVGTAIPKRMSEGRLIDNTSDDNAHVLLDFGDQRFANVMTGFTIQKYRSPAVELYGTDGVLQMLGDDWAPEGFEQWRNDREVWEVHPETEPTWPWTSGLRHLVECAAAGRPTVSRPEHARHALEVMLAAQRSAVEGRFIDIDSDFPALQYPDAVVGDGHDRRKHDPRTT